MQHKGLFVALCCGALCLTGCIKNIESESVTKIREATASKLLSEAQLNKAQADAVATAASAEASLKAAQAKLLEAQAKIAEAEAALVKAQAELQEIENEIMKVKLDEEREELKRKKAEVEKQIAEYEAAIAWAQAAQQAAINALEDLQAQAEIQAVKNEAELLKQEQELLKQAKTLRDDLHERLETVWGKYKTALNNYYTSQADLLKKQAQLAKLETGRIGNAEILVDKIIAKQEEIAVKEAELEQLEEYAVVTKEELDILIEEVREASVEAQNAYAAASQNLSSAGDEYDALDEADYAFEHVVPTVTAFVTTSIPHVLAPVWAYNEEEDSYEYGINYFNGIDDDDNLPATFVPLVSVAWYSETSEMVTDYHYMIEDGYVLYPEPVDGIIEENMVPAYYRMIPTEFEFQPTKAFYDNFDDYFTAILDAKQADVEGQQKQLDDEYEAKIAEIDDEVAPLAARVLAYTTYVEAAQEEMEEAISNQKDAEEAENEANDARQKALKLFNEYCDNFTDDPATKALINAEGEAGDAMLEAASDLASSEMALALSKEGLFLAKEIVKDALTDKYEADSILVVRKNEAKDLKVKVTDAIKKALSDAQKAYDDKIVEIADLEAKTEKALADYRAANLLYMEDPSNAHKEAWQKAQNDLKDAKKAVSDANKELAELEGKLTKAQEAFDAVNDPYEEAEEAVKSAEEDVEEAAKALKEAQDALGNENDMPTEAEIKDGKATAWGEYNYWVKYVGNENDGVVPNAAPTFAVMVDEPITTAWERYNKAKKAFEKAHSDIVEAGLETDEVYNTLYIATTETEIAWTEAKAELIAAKSALTTVQEKYPHYEQYFKQIDPENKAYANKPKAGYNFDGNKVPRQYLARIAWFEAHKEVVTAKYEEACNDLAEIVPALEEKIEEFKAELAEFQSMEEQYLAYGEQMVEADKAYYEAYIPYIDAYNAAYKAKATYQAYQNLKNAKIYYDETGTGKTAEQLQTMIAQKKEALVIANKELEELYQQYENLGMYNEGTKEYEIEAYAKLVSEIEQLEASINVYLAEIESYSAELDAIIALLEEVEPEVD